MLRWLFDWWRPHGETLQERYPAAPGVFTTSYSSVDLPEEAFVPYPRIYGDQALIDICQQFRGTVEDTLRELRTAAVDCEATIAEVGPTRAYQAWRQKCRELLGERTGA